MKRKNLTILLLMLIPFSFLCCASTGDQDSDKPGKPSVSSGSTVEAFPAENWTHETEIINAGMKNEGSISRLFYRYNELTAAFNRVIIGGHIFIFEPMANPWDKWGYLHTGDESFQNLKTVGTINRSELKNGWYQAEEGIKKGGTPNNWILAESEIINVWISPDNLPDVIELFGLKISPAPGLLQQAVKTGE